ncbi:hypothetical protein J6590_095319 [Homalodisca vitripennis]|nr:hypothetical protein J6590_075775 [Homalodisca vitripennis]KAG8334228.1 hypothetical protein J6590_095319 [Homalodisca vitripennis]
MRAFNQYERSVSGSTHLRDNSWSQPSDFIDFCLGIYQLLFIHYLAPGIPQRSVSRYLKLFVSSCLQVLGSPDFYISQPLAPTAPGRFRLLQTPGRSFLQAFENSLPFVCLKFHRLPAFSSFHRVASPGIRQTQPLLDFLGRCRSQPTTYFYHTAASDSS